MSLILTSLPFNVCLDQTAVRLINESITVCHLNNMHRLNAMCPTASFSLIPVKYALFLGKVVKLSAVTFYIE